MNKRIAIFSLGIIIVLVGIHLLGETTLRITVPRTLSYKNCKAEYNFYVAGQVKLYEGHYITNAGEYESANRKLAHCLCEQYLRTKDVEMKEKILDLAKGYSGLKEGSYTFDTLIHKRDIIFDSVAYME